ncbi:hypothetical protein [Cysteiniphilum marinum]|uniref:hypothetical protein n=1 Tax=Cysteiniphilum marinum TaxID=2774191 RepID=UPI00193BDB3A|nr:hypothetical protein [Cysteiniphilum marinum]
MFFNIIKNRIESGSEPDKYGQNEQKPSTTHKAFDVQHNASNAQALFATHYDLIEFCYSSIVEAFSELDAEAPDVATLSSGVTLSENKFKKANPFNKKDKGKIGYVIDLHWHNNMPTFKLSINSFVGGGRTVALNSYEVVKPYLLELQNNHKDAEAIRADIRRKRAAKQKEIDAKKAQLKAKEQQETAERLANFKAIDGQYKLGSDDLVLSHPYILNKGIKYTGDMRVIDGNRLCIPIYGLNERYLIEQKTLHSERIKARMLELKGYQVIDAFGNKRIYVSKSGDLVSGFQVVKGSLEHAKNVLVAEGYASSEKALQCAKFGNVCAISAISASNMPKVIASIKKYFGKLGAPKQLHIASDNDLAKQLEGKANAGIRYGIASLSIAGKDGKIYIPRVEDNQTDWDDVYRADRLNAKRQFVPSKLSELELALLLLNAFASKEHNGSTSQVEFAIKKALKSLIHLVPAYISLERLIKRLYDAAAHTAITLAKVEYLANKAFASYANKANRGRTLTAEHVDEYIEVENIDKAKAIIDAINSVSDQHVILLKAEMGLGKTQGVINPLFKQAENDGACPVTISPNRSLVKSIAHSVDASHYMYDADHDFSVNFNSKKVVATGLATTINSFPCVRLQGFTVRTSVLMIDEATQVYRAMAMGTIPVQSRQKTEQMLIDTMNRCRQSIFADADLNDVVAEHIKKRVNDGTKVIAVVVTPKKRDDLTYRYFANTDQQFNHALNLKALIEDAKQGEKIFVPTDSLMQAKTIQQMLLKNVDHEIISKEQILLISSETVGEQRSQKFFDQPDNFVKENDIKVVITTPAVQSGISLQVPYFTKCYAFYFGTVLPTDMAQMMHRVRYLKEFTISLPCPTPKYDQYNEYAQYIYLETLKMYIDSGLANIRYHQDIKDLKVVDGKVMLDDNIEMYEQLAAELKALETQQRNNATNFFLIQAQSKGIKLINALDVEDDDGNKTPQDISPEAKKEIKAEAKEVKQLIKDADIQAVLESQSIEKEEYQKLVNSEHTLTQEQKAIKLRYDIEQMCGHEDLIEDDVVFYEKDGKRKISNALMAEDIRDAIKKDKQEIEDGVSRCDRVSHSKAAMLLHHCYVQLGLDEQDLSGSFTHEDAKRLKDIILADSELVTYIRLTLKIKLDDGYLPTRLATLLLSKLLGLKAKVIGRSRKEDRIQRYGFDPLEVERFLAYVAVERARRDAKKASHNVDNVEVA